MARVRRHILAAASGLLLVAALGALAKTHAPIYDSDIASSTLARKLSAIKLAASPEEHSSVMQWAFDRLFPFGARWNSVLATFYISSFPNFILALVPADLDPASLNTMIAFATGGLLGDVCLHLIPHAFLGESGAGAADGAGPKDAVRFVMVEEKRNIVIGGAIFAGFFAFFFLDKTMRTLNASAGGEGHAHGHGHGHGHAHTSGLALPKADSGAVRGASSAVATAENGAANGELRKRGGKGDEIAVVPPVEEVQGKKDGASASLKLSAYLNLFGDFTHNITDGLAMAASFYASPQLGAISTFATFCHEIPHEIADYSILIKSGFTKRQAMSSQFLTAGGAFLGTFLGIWIAEGSGMGAGAQEALAASRGTDLAAVVAGKATGFLGTSVVGADLVIPATAGGFLYIASVSVIPELLEESKSGKQAIKEFGFMIFGVLVMGLLAWNE